MKGSAPVRWTLVQSPTGMKINTGTGLVDWQYVEANSVQYEIQAKASNIIGSDIVTWNILVPRSYSVVVSRVEPSGRLPVPKSIMIFGDVIFNNGSSLRTVPIDVRFVVLLCFLSKVLSRLFKIIKYCYTFCSMGPLLVASANRVPKL